MLQLLAAEPYVPVACYYSLYLCVMCRSSSAVGVPRFTIEAAKRFRHLLPGGCKRQEDEYPKLGSLEDANPHELP